MTLSTFGKGRPRKPRPLVDTTPRICVYDVRGVATAPLTALAREEITVVINGAEMVIDVVRDARHLGGDGQRYFLCPDCSRKVWHLYVRDERLACRKCAALDYRSRHVRRRGLNRARRLRQKLGAPAGLLGPIPPKPPRWRRDHWTRTVAELAVAEGRIAGMLHAMIPRVRRRLKHD
jgi:hypothetical protein